MWNEDNRRGIGGIYILHRRRRVIWKMMSTRISGADFHRAEFTVDAVRIEVWSGFGGEKDERVRAFLYSFWGAWGAARLNHDLISFLRVTTSPVKTSLHLESLLARNSQTTRRSFANAAACTAGVTGATSRR
jgi:hypothetical protein